jgi:hypothetical protein
MITILYPRDACPSPDCAPFDRDPCLPLCVEPLEGGGVLGSYECGCGLGWQREFDRHGWQGPALIADMAERRAAA